MEAWLKFREFAKELGEDIPSPWEPTPRKDKILNEDLTIIGSIGNGSQVSHFPVDPGLTTYEDHPVARIQFPISLSSEAIVVNGNAMKPKYDDGDLICVGFDLKDIRDIPEKPFLGYVEYGEGKAIVGQITAVEEHIVNIYAFNADPLVRILWSRIRFVQAIIPAGRWLVLRDRSAALSKKYPFAGNIR